MLTNAKHLLYNYELFNLYKDNVSYNQIVDKQEKVAYYLTGIRNEGKIAKTAKATLYGHDLYDTAKSADICLTKTSLASVPDKLV